MGAAEQPPTPPSTSHVDVMLAVLDIMSRGAVLLGVNPRYPGIALPDVLRNTVTQVLCFGWGRYMKNPINDMSIDASGIRGTLSFARKPFCVDIPWGAVWRAYGPNDRMLMWGENLPEGMEGGVQVDAAVVKRLEDAGTRQKLSLVPEEPPATDQGLVTKDVDPPVGVRGWTPTIVPRGNS